MGALFSLLTVCLAPQDEPPKPTEHHRHLKALVGTWDTVTRYPQMKELPEAKGVDTTVMAFRGLWLISDYKIETPGRTVEGHGILGYDVEKKKYVGVWIDSWSTRLDLNEGECDGEGKVHTWRSEAQDHTGKMTRWKIVHQSEDLDTRVLTIHRIDAGEKETPVMVCTYRRRK